MANEYNAAAFIILFFLSHLYTDYKNYKTG